MPVRPVAAVLKELAMLPAADVAASTPELISESTEEYAEASVNADVALSTSSLTLESTEARSVLVLTKAEASDRSELRSCAYTAVLVRDNAVRRYVKRMVAESLGWVRLRLKERVVW